MQAFSSFFQVLMILYMHLPQSYTTIWFDIVLLTGVCLQHSQSRLYEHHKLIKFHAVFQGV